MTPSVIQSLAETVEVYYEELKAFITRRTGSAVLAADVIQETWLRAVQVRPITAVVSPRAYLYRIANNIALDHLRREQSWASHHIDAEMPESIIDPQPGPEQTIAAWQDLDALCEAVRELPERCRAVFLLYRERGLTMRQVAEAVGISEKTVEKHIAKAMVHCRQRLREEDCKK